MEMCSEMNVFIPVDKIHSVASGSKSTNNFDLESQSLII